MMCCYRVHHTEGYVERLEIRRPALTATNTYHYYRRDHLGNNCAVWDAANDTTLQKTVYYASGLPLSVSSGQSPYLAQVSQLVPNVFFKVINLEVVNKQKVLTDLYQLGLFRTQSQNIFT